MRLSLQQVETIKRLLRTTYGEWAQIRLFGSQVHDHRRGGDIDLLVRYRGMAVQPIVQIAREAGMVF